MNYAIVENGMVVNLISLNEENASDFPNAAPVGTLPVFIGDAYMDGGFYRNGELVDLLLDEEDDIIE